MLNKLQSKVTIVLVSIAVLCLSSCGNSLSFKMTDLAVDIPAQIFRQVAEKTAYSTKGLPVSAQVELFVDGKSYALDSQDYQEGNEASVLFRFKNIPLDSKAYAKVSLIQDDVELAQGDSDPITVKAGSNKIVVPLALIKYSVPKTKYMLYKERYERVGEYAPDYYYDYYLCDTPDEIIPDSRTADFKSVITYCFDADGYVYAISKIYQDTYWKYILNSNKPGFVSKEIDGSSVEINEIVCDLATNEIYIRSSNQAQIQFEEINSNKSIKGYNYELGAQDIYDFIPVLINNNTIYFI